MKNVFTITLLAFLISCGGPSDNSDGTKELDKAALTKFLTEYNAEYQRLLTRSAFTSL